MSVRKLSRLTLVFVTMARPDCARRLIETARRFYPDLRIVMVEQVDGPSPLAEVAAAAGIEHLVLPFDAGVSRARNVAVRAVRTEYFILADDDFVFLKSTVFDPALEFMDAHPDVAFLGGDLEEREIGPSGRVKASFPKARNILLDKTGRGIVILSAEMLKTNWKSFNGQRYQFCDMVAQWGVGRAASFHDAPLLWDERFKTGGEHYDFFLAWKQDHPELKSAHTPTLLCAHEPIREPQYNAYRYREEWTSAIAEKWAVEYLFLSGGNIRWFSDFNKPEKPYDNTGTRVLFDKMKADHQRLAQQFRAALERIDHLKKINETNKETIERLRNSRR